jgi:hypothetical protein
MAFANALLLLRAPESIVIILKASFPLSTMCALC